MDRTNVTDTGYSYGGKDYTYETRLDANNNPYRVDVPVGTAPALNKAPDGTMPSVPGNAPRVSTTTISNTNKIAEVPKIVSRFDSVKNKGITTDNSGVPRYADGSQVPDYTDPTIPEGTAPIYGTVNGVGNRIVGYNTPNLERGGMTATYLDSTGQSTDGTSVEDRQTNAILESMKATTDAATKRMLDNIQSRMELRRQQLQEINASQLAGARNSLLMGDSTGQGSMSQYAPLASANIVGDQQRLAIMDLAKLDVEEQDLIAQAEAARENADFKRLEKSLALIDEKRQAKIEAAKKVSENMAAEDKKAREQLVNSKRSQSIASAYSQGFTDVPSILNELKRQGVNVTSAQVADALKDIVPPGLDDLVKTLRINGAPQEVLQKVLSSANINDAYKNAGAYSAGGTGIIGEYNFYRSQAEAKGQIPVDFNTYQDMDANRKRSIARAGAVNTSATGSPVTYANDLEAFVDNVVNLIPTKFGQETFRNSLRKARSDSDKIRVAATVVLKESPATVKEAFANQAVAVKELDKAIALIDSGVKTGALQKGQQYTYNLVGKDFDPKLAKIEGYITSAIQPYRSVITGAAWGEQEDAEYASLFGSTKYEPEELKQRLQQVKEMMLDKSVQGLSSQVDPLNMSDTNFFETKNTMVNNLVQSEDEAKKMIDAIYATLPLDTTTAIKTLFNKNYTNAQVVEYLKAKGIIKI